MAKKIEALEIQLTAGQAAAELDKLAKAADNAGNEVKQVDEGFKTLKQQLKEAQNEAQLMAQKFGDTSKQAVEAQKKVARLKDEVGDFNARVEALNPEAKLKAFGQVAQGVAGGFAAAQGAMALFGNESEDVQKVLLKVQAALALTQGIEAVMGLGDAFKTLNVVIKANPIVFIVGAAVAALVWLGENVKAVGDFFYEMGQLAATALKYMTLGLVDFTDELSASEIAQEKVNQKIKQQTDAVNKSNEALDEQIKKNRESEKEINRKYDNEIKLARAAGKETTELERAKLKATVNRIAKEIELEEKKLQNYVKIVAVQKGLTEKQAEDLIKGTTFYGNLFKGAQDNIKNLKKELENSTTDLNAFNIQANREYYEKKQEQAKKDAELAKEKAEKEKRQRELERKADEDDAAYIARLAAESSKREEERLAKEKKDEEDRYLASIARFEEEQKLKEEIAKREEERRRRNQEFTLESLQQSIDIAASFMDTAMNRQLQAAQGNEAKQEAIRKKFFERNKKMQIAQTLITTYQSATAAYASQLVPLDPSSPVRGAIAAGLAVAAGLANVAKIASQKYEGGGSSGGGGSQGGSPQTIPNLTAPESGATQNVGTTQLNRDQIEQGNAEPIKVFVTETDITNSQNRVNRIQARATID